MKGMQEGMADVIKGTGNSLPPLPVEVKHIGICQNGCRQNLQVHVYEDGSEKEIGCKCETFEKLRQQQKETKQRQFIANSDVPYSRRQSGFDKYIAETNAHHKAKAIAMNYADKFNKNISEKRLFTKVAKYADEKNITLDAANEHFGTNVEEKIENIKTNLILMGTPGTGKTMLSNAIFYSVKEQGYMPFFIESTKFIETLKEGFNDPEKKYKLIRFIEEADLLIVDDIGTAFNSPWAVEQFKMLTDKRLDKFTIYTTNLTEKDFTDSMDLHRIFSRMNHKSHLLEMNFDDKRL